MHLFDKCLKLAGQNKSNPMNIVKNFRTALGVLATAALFGCSGLTNLSPQKVPQNPSNIYTLSVRAEIADAVVKGSVKPFVIIDEKKCLMTEVSNRSGDRVFEYEYHMPRGRTEAKYYYQVEYKCDTGAGGIVDRKLVSPTVYKIESTARYASSLAFDRGPVGAVVPVTGRGFNSQDRIRFGGVMADVDSVSRNTLNFIVPPLQAGRIYDVELVGENGSTWIGSFKVDPSRISVSPSSIEISSGDVVNVVFNIGFRAPEGGYPIDVTTNIPSSVVMPEVEVKPGEDRAVVQLKGVGEGSGNLYINALGFRETVVPVTVKLSDPSSSGILRQVQEKAGE